MKRYISLLTVSVTFGCGTIGPDYAAPPVDAPAIYVGAVPTKLASAPELSWWQDLNDRTLNELVSIGLVQNLDVRAAIERIVEAEQNAKRFEGVVPLLSGQVSGTGSARRVFGDNFNQTSADASASFGFDIFGEFQRAQEQSLAQWEATKFEAGSVKLVYLSELLSAYTSVRRAQASTDITQETVNSRRETLSIIRQKADQQQATQLEISQAEALLASAEASLPVFEAQVWENSFRIATLLDVPVSVVESFIAIDSGIPTPPNESNAGVPADLLRHRPDVRASERNLAAATAAIGVSEAQLYPSIRLTGNVSLDDTSSWSFGPTFSFPIFQRGTRLAERNAAVSRAKQAEIAYRQTFISAVEDVHAALAQTRARKEQVRKLVVVVASSRRVQQLSKRSYEGGVVALDTVLDAERTQLNNRLSLAQAQSDYTLAWVRQQIAVGLGWSVPKNAEFDMIGNMHQDREEVAYPNGRLTHWNPN